jgi:hypothetical protein
MLCCVAGVWHLYLLVHKSGLLHLPLKIHQEWISDMTIPIQNQELDISMHTDTKLRYLMLDQ